MIECYDFTIDDAVVQGTRGLRDGSKIGSSVEPFAGAHDCLAVGNPQLHAVSV